MLKTGLTTLFFFAAFAIAVHADVPPEPGFSRVTVAILLETNDDLAEFRFFLQSGQMVQEVFVKKGEQTRVGALGGGALYRSGTLLAVPAKSLVSFGSDKKAIESAILEQRVPDVIKLVDHRFTLEVRTAEADGLKDAVYRLERTKGGSVTAVAVSDKSSTAEPKTTPYAAPYGVSGSIGMAGWGTIIGGCLLTLGLISFGAMMFRRKAQNV